MYPHIVGDTCISPKKTYDGWIFILINYPLSYHYMPIKFGILEFYN